MVTQDLSDFDNDFSIIFERKKSWIFQGITSLEDLKENHLLLINSKNFLESFKGRFQKGPDKFNWSSLGLLFGKKFFERIYSENEEELKWLKESFSTIITVEDFEMTKVKLSKRIYEEKFQKINLLEDGLDSNSDHIHETSKISKKAFIGENVVIGKNVIVGSNVSIMANSEIGEGTVLYPNSTIYPFVKIGKNCIIHAGVVIGADGFGYHFSDGIHHKIWHSGGVQIGDDVEVGANSCIDGGTFSPTKIGAGTKIDNHVQIGHNCQIGKGVVFCGQVALGGSTVIGDFCVFGGKAGVSNGITLGSGCQVGGGGMINSNWPSGAVLGGHPARPLKEWMRGLAYVRKQSLRPNGSPE